MHHIMFPISALYPLVPESTKCFVCQQAQYVLFASMRSFRSLHRYNFVLLACLAASDSVVTVAYNFMLLACPAVSVSVVRISCLAISGSVVRLQRQGNGQLWPGVARCGQTWPDVARCGQLWPDVARCGQI